MKPGTDAAIETAIKLAANGNAEADIYLRIIARAARLIDDIEDDDVPGDIGFLAHLLLVALPSNRFFVRHALSLIPLHDMAVNAWQDSNKRTTQDLAWDFWADLVNEIACMVAGLTGGYEYRRKVSCEIRQLLYRELFKVDEQQKTIALLKTKLKQSDQDFRKAKREFHEMLVQQDISLKQIYEDKLQGYLIEKQAGNNRCAKPTHTENLYSEPPPPESEPQPEIAVQSTEAQT